MGRGIVYCGGCGKRLLDEDFVRGEANVVDDQPYCVQCRPAPEPPPPSKGPVSERRLSAAPARRLGSSARHAAIPDRKGSKAPLALIGGGIAGALILVIVLVALGSGRKEPAPVEEAETPPRSVAKTAPKAAVDPGVEALKKLESAAAGSDPDAVLQAVDEARRLLRGTPQERRIEEIEAKALAARREKNRERELEKALAEAKRMEEADPEFLRSAETEGMLGAAHRLAGPRTDEVQRRLDDYRRRAREAAEKRGKGPFELDGQGYVLNWLVLGPFPNADDKGYDTDFLKGEAAHAAKEGLEVGKLRWGLHASSSGRVRFHEAPSLGLRAQQPQVVCYAACKVQVPSDLDVVLRVGSDDGYVLWLDGRELGRVHQHRGAVPDQEGYPVRLAKGMHTMLIKVDQGDGDYEFLLRITLPDGSIPSGVRLWN